MGIQVWYLIASLFLISIKGELNDNGSRYYQKPETSSPAPIPSQPQTNQLTGMKEVVLYLTGDQVKSLQAAGAIVRPFPQFERAFLQQQYQQSVEEPTEPQYQPETANKDPRQEELDEFYKLLNIQQINEDLAIRAQAEQATTEKPRPKYKYSTKLRQQDYSAQYVQKKASKGKSSSTEYVRYLPNYEIEELKMEPFRPLPLPGYSFDGQANYEYPAYYQNAAPEIQKLEEVRRPQQTQEIVNFPTRTYKINNEPVQGQQQQEAPAKVQLPVEDKGPVTFEDKVRESAKSWTSGQVQEPAKTWEPVNIWENAKIQENAKNQALLNTQRYQNIEIPSDGVSPIKQQENRPSTPQKEPSSDILGQTQYSTILAPLVQHEKITENIAKEKQELINKEQAIHNKLKEIKESGSHDQETYAVELDKLNQNLGKQNALAQKLAMEISKQSEAQLEVEKSTSDMRKSKEFLNKKTQTFKPARVLVSIPTPVEVRTPKQYSVPSNVRPIPIPVQLPEKANFQNPAPADDRKHISISGLRNVYVKVDNPYIVQKVVPVQINHEFPVKYPIRQPDELVLRPLWEH